MFSILHGRLTDMVSLRSSYLEILMQADGSLHMATAVEGASDETFSLSLPYTLHHCDNTSSSNTICRSYS